MKKKHTVRTTLTVIAACAIATVFTTGCTEKRAGRAPSIAVFVPGIIADSPTYANLADGVREAVDAYNATLTADGANSTALARLYVMEAGTNQAEWVNKLTALSATGEYDVIISSNEALPELCAPLTAQFPAQKFLLLHGALDGNENIACVDYDQREQCYLSGYISALMSESHKVALIAAQEYPAMNNIMLPYFARGAADAVAGTTTEFRIVGNWYDASKSAEIADALIASGVDVILPICGGAAQGVIASAREHGIHLAYNDSGAFDKAPGVVISSCYTKQKAAAREVTRDFLAGTVAWGTTRRVGLREGYIEFDDKHPLYAATVPAAVRTRMAELVRGFADGSVVIPERAQSDSAVSTAAHTVNRPDDAAETQ